MINVLFIPLSSQVNVSNGQVIFTNGERSIVIPHKASRKQKVKRLLAPQSVEAMNEWYAQHIDYPYPTDEEKQKLADDNGLTVPQVTCWFANKRNRSNNTRKMTPQGQRQLPRRPSPSNQMSSPPSLTPVYPGMMGAYPGGYPGMPAFPMGAIMKGGAMWEGYWKFKSRNTMQYFIITASSNITEKLKYKQSNKTFIEKHELMLKLSN